MPVFRYALERWPASPYEVVVFHRGKLSPLHEALLARLRPADGTNDVAANVKVQSAEVGGRLSEELKALRAGLSIGELPAMVVRSPEGSVLPREFWSGPFIEDAVQRLLVSPVRRRIVRQLLDGDCAVWVLLESGQKAEDDRAARTLQVRLEHLQKTLQLPKLEAEDIANRVISVPEETLKVAFSVLRLSRGDPAEQVFVRMLLATEEDLGGLNEPIAFPIFGRGRMLYALAGKGISDENIDEACSFLIGPCSCIMKEENPGQDLLLSADWDRSVRLQATTEHELPELTGMTALAADSNPPIDAAASGRSQTRLAEGGAAPPASPPPLPPKPPSGLEWEAALKTSVLIGLSVVALGGAVLLWRRQRR